MNRDEACEHYPGAMLQSYCSELKQTQR